VINLDSKGRAHPHDLFKLLHPRWKYIIEYHNDIWALSEEPNWNDGILDEPYLEQLIDDGKAFPLPAIFAFEIRWQSFAEYGPDCYTQFSRKDYEKENNND